ncbi:hypothetical protein QYF36_014968 [Acer negundo]|nr:hypothetical protein QYF36_014968 [Acer negundo]
MDTTGDEHMQMTCQQNIHTLEGQLQEEMSRHAPLYGAGLEALSMKELETLARIHEERLRQIDTLQQCKGSPAGSPLVSPHNLQHNHNQEHLLQWLSDSSQMVLGSTATAGT